MIRVVAFPLDYPPHRFIGSELMTHKLLKALHLAGCPVVVKPRIRQGAWVHDCIAVLGRPSPAPTADVAIVHAGYSWPGVEYRAQTGAPLVMICHNTSEAVQDDVEKARPDLVIVNSETMRAELGVEALVVNPPAPPVTSLPGGDRIVTLSLNGLKGGAQFLRLAGSMPERRFLGVRSGYGRQHDADLPNLEVLDHVPHDQLAERVWSQAGVFLQLSESESWGMAAAEAQAHGVPVIAHPTSGLRENLGSAAVWVDRDDTRGLAAAVEQVLADRSFRWAAVARARERARGSAVQVAGFVEAIGRLGDGSRDQRDGAARGVLAGAG